MPVHLHEVTETVFMFNSLLNLIILPYLSKDLEECVTNLLKKAKTLPFLFVHTIPRTCVPQCINFHVCKTTESVN